MIGVINKSGVMIKNSGRIKIGDIEISKSKIFLKSLYLIRNYRQKDNQKKIVSKEKLTIYQRKTLISFHQFHEIPHNL